MYSENFKADFLKMYQNNEQTLQIWDMQIFQIAQF